MRCFVRALLAPLVLALSAGMLTPTMASAKQGQSTERGAPAWSHVWDEDGPRARLAKAFYSHSDADDDEEARPRPRYRGENMQPKPQPRPGVAQKKQKRHAKQPHQRQLARHPHRQLTRHHGKHRHVAQSRRSTIAQSRRPVAAQSRRSPTRQAKAPAWTKRSLSTTPGPSGSGQHGIASYYWQPQPLASGGRFDPDAMTAAHRTLPFGTRVKVTHLASGRSVEVKINDRGPYIAGRIIDLSRAAAGVIGMTQQGIARVAVEVLGR